MRWIKYTIHTTTEVSELLSAELMTINGINGVEIQDNLQITKEEQASIFADILPDLPEDNGEASVSFYLDEALSEKECDEVLSFIRDKIDELSVFANTGNVSITREVLDDDDFKDNWKEFFHPFKIDDDIVIRPVWEDVPEELKKSKAIIALDPGMAFGTGQHETTRLCMLNIKKYMKTGDSVIDIGTGSGILAILAKMLGAGVILGTDIDPTAVDIAVENTLQNHISSKRLDHVVKSDLSKDHIVYSFTNVFEKKVRQELRSAFNGGPDVVIANILADVIVPIAGFVKEIGRPGAIFISSGIYKNRVEEVRTAVSAANLEIIEITSDGDWNSFVCRI